MPSLYTAASSLSLDQLRQHTSTPSLGNTPIGEKWHLSQANTQLFMLKCACTKPQKHILRLYKVVVIIQVRGKAKK